MNTLFGKYTADDLCNTSKEELEKLFAECHIKLHAYEKKPKDLKIPKVDTKDFKTLATLIINRWKSFL